MYVPVGVEIAFGVGTECSLNLLHDFHQIPSYDTSERGGRARIGHVTRNHDNILTDREHF